MKHRACYKLRILRTCYEGKVNMLLGTLAKQVAVDGGEWSVSRASVPSVETAPLPLNRRLSGPQIRYGRYE